MDSSDFSSNISEKINNLEEIELKDGDETREDVYKQLLIYYLLEEEPMKAKFLWKRIPSSLKPQEENSASELARLWSLCKLFIQRQYSQAFELINRHNNSSELSFFKNGDLNKILRLLLDKTRERLVDLVSVAYSSINTQELANLLCLDLRETRNLCLQKQNWEQDESGEYLRPGRKEASDVVEIPNRIQMNQLTSLVSYLEAV
jgi:hypothetical protein